MTHYPPPKNARLLLAMGIIVALLLIALLSMWAQPLFVASKLSRLGPGDARRVPYAIEQLQSRSAAVRQAAARGLGAIGPQAQEAVPELLLALDDESPGVAAEAAAALGRIQPPGEEAIDGLILALDHKDGEVRRYAAFALSQFGGRAQAAGPALTSRLRDEHMAYMAARVLREVQAASPEALEPLTAMLTSSHMGERLETALTLADLQPLPDATVVAIEALASDKEEVVRRAATTALEKIRSAKMAGDNKN